MTIRHSPRWRIPALVIILLAMLGALPSSSAAQPDAGDDYGIAQVPGTGQGQRQILDTNTNSLGQMDA